MVDKTDNNISGASQEKQICFKCKFCGETKPLSELVVLRQYYPQISACKICARTTRTSSDST